ncbi:glycosyltransferase [Frankia umida]|uniref:glycosyltransferase n=1 Tax=Frankia umida TaxID=573489 RepID=UPI00355742B8
MFARAKASAFDLLTANARDLGRVPLGVAQARSLVAGWEPDAVIATGGYVGVPVGLAARMCRRPLVAYEQTVRLGLANRTLAESDVGMGGRAGARRVWRRRDDTSWRGSPLRRGRRRPRACGCGGVA